MAYLNVRERRIEARIAYVGPDLAGKATNFDWLRRTTRDSRIGRVDSSSEGGDLLSIVWQSPERTRFRDCDVLVRVVAYRGAASAQRFDDVLSEADGVVLVVDAHPGAQLRNRESLAALREAMQRAERSAVPTVVQVNKTDLTDALPIDEVVSAMDAGALPHVAAAAVRGDGVVDTLEAALDEVLASMQREGAASEAALAAQQVANEAQVRASGEAGHPLLNALRQVLRETVREHALELEGRMVARIDQHAVRAEDSLRALRQDTVAGNTLVLASVNEIVRELQTQRRGWFK